MRVFLRRRVEGRAATGPVLRNPAEHCSGLQKVFPVNSSLFWGCYCNFNVIFCLFVLKLYFCTVDVKKTKKKEKIINKKRGVCVCVFFFMYVIEIKRKNEFNILIYMHKYLKER
jgi:hypothetical protein